MADAAGVAAEAGWQPRRGNTSSDTAANEKTCRRRSGKRWEKQRDEE